MAFKRPAIAVFCITAASIRAYAHTFGAPPQRVVASTGGTIKVNVGGLFTFWITGLIPEAP